jgi:hypothetical protein
MSDEIYRDEHYCVDFIPRTRLMRFTRSALPQTAAMLDAFVNQIAKVVVPLHPTGLLLDMRQAPGNNDPVFEQAAMAATQKLLTALGIAKVAVLIQTAVGRLHFQRLSRERQQPLYAFSDEAEALQFLRDQALVRPGS